MIFNFVLANKTIWLGLSFFFLMMDNIFFIIAKHKQAFNSFEAMANPIGDPMTIANKEIETPLNTPVITIRDMSTYCKVREIF